MPLTHRTLPIVRLYPSSAYILHSTTTHDPPAAGLHRRSPCVCQACRCAVPPCHETIPRCMSSLRAHAPALHPQASPASIGGDARASGRARLVRLHHAAVFLVMQCGACNDVLLCICLSAAWPVIPSSDAKAFTADSMKHAPRRVRACKLCPFPY
jgi:hypothetical protein